MCDTNDDAVKSDFGIAGLEVRRICVKCGKVQSITRDFAIDEDDDVIKDIDFDKPSPRIFTCRFCGHTFDVDHPKAPCSCRYCDK